MPKRFHNSEHYAGRDARRAQEHADAGMVPSGSGSFANMPTEYVFKPFPNEGGSLPENLNDKLSGVDGQIGMDKGGMHKHLHPKKV